MGQNQTHPLRLELVRLIKEVSKVIPFLLGVLIGAVGLHLLVCVAD